MKQSRTTLKELTAAYRAVLRHAFLCNAIALGLLAVTPAMAAAPNTGDTAFVFGDVSWANQNVAYGQAAFGGRRMDVWNGTQYQNDFPKYQMVGRSLEISDSDIYVGPVTLTLRELGADEAFKFNYQWTVAGDPETDIDLASDEWAGVKWNDTFHSVIDEDTGETLSVGVYEKLSDVIGAGNANYTAEPVFAMSRRDDSVAAATMSFANTTAMIDGSTINADSISVTDGSVLTFANQDHSKLGAFLPGDIDSNGETTLNTRTMTVDGSRMIVNADASLTLNATDGATIANGVTEDRGGAIYNHGELNIVGTDGNYVLFDSNTAGVGGAIAADVGSTTNIDYAKFEHNSATNWVGVIDNKGALNVNHSVFYDNDGNKAWGAIMSGSDAISTVIKNTLFEDNTADEVGAVSLCSVDNELNNVQFIHNTATLAGASSDGAGALFLGAVSRTVMTDVVFDNNETAARGGAISTRSADLANNSEAKVDILQSKFVDNTAGTTGGAIDNFLYSSKADDTAVYVADTLFKDNNAASGGAIYNHGESDKAGNIASMKIVDSKFTGNTAAAMGGAIYNAQYAGLTVVAQDKDVFFTGNNANGSANDIYNAGTLALDAGEGRLLSLAGGIDGSAGTLNVTGAGTVDIANALKNQTVTQTAGELHLINADLTGSAIAVNAGTINTIDNAVADYSSLISLADGANVKADASDTAVDKFALATNDTVNLTSLNLLADIATTKDLQLTTSGKIAVADTVKTYTSASKYTVAGSTDNSGNITVTNAGVGGLFAAADDTTAGARETVTYSVTGNDATVDTAAEIKNADLIVKGNGGTNAVSLAAALTVGNASSLTIEDASFAGTGAIDNTENAVLNIKDSSIGVVINNSGTLVSDPTTYTETINNTGTASFDADTFASTAVINNSGTVNLANGVIFDSGAKITGSGVTNLVNGMTTFADTASSNTIKLASGADFTGALASTGVLDTRNDSIDTISGSVTGGGLYVDANLTGATGAIDGFGSSAGATIKEIKILDSEYGTRGSYALNVGGASLANDLAITGATNYFTKVVKDGDNIVFGDKLMNTSGMHAQLGDWVDGNYILTSSTYDAATGSYTAQGQTVGGALTALDEAVAGKVSKSDIYTALVDDTPVAGGDGKVLSVNAFQNSIQNLMDNVGINWTQEQGFDGGLTIGDDFGVAADGAATLGATTVSSLTVGGQTTSGIDTTVTANSTNLVTSGAVSSAIAGLNETVSGHTSAINTLNGGVNVANSVDNKIATALANSGFQTSGNVTAAIVSQGQNAEYNASTVQAGTVGAAIKDINNVLGTIDGLIADADATTTADGVTPYSGNLAVGTTVEQHLLALDAAVGDMRGFAATDGTGNAYATNTESVAANLVALDTAAQSNAGAIAAINNSDVMQSGIDSGKVAQITTNKTNIAANASAIETLNSDAATEGSVANTAKGYVDALANGAVANNTNAITILNSDASVEGSVANKIAAAESLNLTAAKNFAMQRDALTLGAANAYTDARVEKLDKNLSAGVAGAVALSSVAVSNVRRGEVSVGAGYGYFNGQSAGAFGAALGVSNRWSVNAGAGVSGYDVSFRAGTNYKFKLF